MRRVLAIARLTLREGVRMRIVLVFLVVLVLLVLRMPFALRGDETLAGRLQNFLAYSLGALSLLMSLATVFFSCATLSNEFKEQSLHLVVTKPVTRFQILLGKWLGVNALNILIVLLCGGTIYGLAYFIQSRPEQFARDRYKLRDVVWTARVAARPVVPRELIAQAAADDIRARIRRGELEPARERAAIAERYDELLKRWRVVERGEMRIFEFENLVPPDRPDTVFQVRYKIIGTPLPLDELVTVGFAFCDPESGAPLEPPVYKRERSGDTHQFLASAAPLIKNGRAALLVHNPYDPSRSTGLLFDGANSLQILYKAGGFEMNFVRAVLIVLLRLALLSAIGVFFSVFVSFPVACLCAGAFYLICLGMPFWIESIGADVEIAAKYDPLGAFGPLVRQVLVPGLKFFFPDFSYYDGTNRLVEGEYVSYALLGRCLLHTLVYGGLLLLAPGWLIFRAREVAEVQV